MPSTRTCPTLRGQGPLTWTWVGGLAEGGEGWTGSFQEAFALWERMGRWEALPYIWLLLGA